MFVADSGTPTIRNVALLSRRAELAVVLGLVLDGTAAASNGTMLRGSLLVPSANQGKWRPFVHGTDTLAVDAVRILQDDIAMSSGVDAFGSAYSEGFFNLADLLDANTGLVAADLTVAAGFHAIAAQPGGSVTEYRLK